MEVQVTYSAIESSVFNHLSVIGKRVKDEKGNSAWVNITASTAEKVVLVDYIKSACEKIVSTLSLIVDKAYYSSDNTKSVIYLENARWDETEVTETGSSTKHKGVNEYVINLCQRFVQSYCISEFLNMFAPNYAKKYETEELSILEDLRRIALKKKASPASSKSYINVGMFVHAFNVTGANGIIYTIKTELDIPNLVENDNRWEGCFIYKPDGTSVPSGDILLNDGRTIRVSNGVIWGVIR